MDGYYHRAYGLDAQMREDRYVTDLANSQASSTGQTAAVYCSGTEKLFGQVLASRSWDDLVLLTGAKPLPVPAPEAACVLALPKTKPKEIEAQAASVLVMNQPEVAEETAPATHMRTPEEIEAAEAAGMLVRNQPPVAPKAQFTEKRRVETRFAHNDLKSRKALAAKSTKPAATTIL
jgi:NADPH-dependent 2,4-dienoyl-CoA reductase/sulfur reductase-like enzyme